ncbi:MAG: cytochrome c3 family protein [Phycisphaerales bacterium]|nr:MAG: cytochrome c3 family protein [Phycisphaerales bacterium]
MRTDDTLVAIVIVFVIFVTVIFLSCTPATDNESAEINVEISAQHENSASGGPPPLVVDTVTPLLLEEPDRTQQDFSAPTSGASAENATCFVCHANYRVESLADRHARADIGCAHCHGDSVAHKNDENNTTPPETMYSADKIDLFCRSCHATHDVSPGKVVVRWIERGLDKSEAEGIVCTDCHGDHRMKVRTVIWDKSSGELLCTNKGR